MMTNAADWWKKLDPVWQDLFLINYVFEYRFSEQMKKELIVLRVNPFDNYRIKLQADFERFEPDEEKIRSMQKMTSFFASGTGIKELNPLTELKELKKLDISYNPGIDLAQLHTFKALNFLVLERCVVSDLTPLKQLIELKELYLRDNRITSIDVLSLLHKLNILDISLNEIADITPLCELTALEILYAEYNLIEEAGCLSGLPLKVLNIANNKIDPAHLASLIAKGVKVVV
jgi:hypothetical protein